MPRDQVFISYSHKDKKWLERLQVMLAPLKRKAKIKVWADTQIDPGKKWKEEIQLALKSTKVAVLLVSPDFLASEFIHNNELPSLLTAAEKEGLTILWVLVSDCAYRLTVIADYQAAYSLDRPLDYLRPAQQKTALVKIVTRIEEAWSSSPSFKPVNPAIMVPQVPPPKPEPLPEPAEPIAGLRDKLQDGSLGPKMAWLPGGVFKPYQGFQDPLRDGTAAPEMVYLPDGMFKMGDIQGIGHRDEKPVHAVTLDAFAIGRYPMTVGEFRRFVDAKGYRTEAEHEGGAYVWDGKEWSKKSDANWRNPYFSQADRHPVVCISWNDASAYCEWLSEQTSEQYSLPTEAEWEYACRASSEIAYCFGDDEEQLGDYAWYLKNSEGRTHPVGERQANRWGLYDMHGNVWEWVRDWFGNYLSEPQHNPSGPESGAFRVFRGGSWGYPADICRSAYRIRGAPGLRGDSLGFRLARRV